MKKFLFIMLVISVAVSACSPASASITGTWKLISFGPVDSLTPAVPDAEASVTFNPDGTLNGNGGCNLLGGDYKLDGEKITFGPIMSTLMACEEDRMEQEDLVHQVMTDAASYTVDGETLTITKDGMVLVFEFIAAE